MMAFTYNLDHDEFVESRDGDVSFEGYNTLMLYPNYAYDDDPNNGPSSVNLKHVDAYGNKTFTTIAEDPDNNGWFVYIMSHDANGDVKEWEYTSDGGHNPILFLLSYCINGEQQKILYPVR